MGRCPKHPEYDFISGPTRRFLVRSDTEEEEVHEVEVHEEG